jgi:hypothetical protein
MLWATCELGHEPGPIRLGSCARPIIIGSWHRTQANWVLTMAHYHWVLTQLHLQDNPSARSHHVVRRSGWVLLVSQRHVALRSNPAQGQAAQAPGVPTWWCRSGSRPRQGKPAPAPRGARSDLA